MQSNQVDWNQEQGMKFIPPATAFTISPPSKLVGLREWTLLMDLTTLPPWRQGRILSYSVDERHCNLSIDQVFDDITVRIRLNNEQKPRELRVEKLFEQSDERRFLLAMVYNGIDLSIYIDGERKIRQGIGVIDYSSWNSSYPLVLGSRADGKYGWKGIFRHLTILDRAVLHEELKASWKSLQDTATAVLRYSFNEGRGSEVVDHGAKEPTHLTWPAMFRPYRRTILQSPLDYWPNPRRPFVMDIIANIIAYIPIGYLICVWTEQKKYSRFASAIPVLTALGLSFTIEVLQAYLPIRNSSTVDIFTNTLGGFFGVYVQRRGWMEVLLNQTNISFRNNPE